jgi:VIT1/CCC1 family predicted Fe2+/Mn2+ transporter
MAELTNNPGIEVAELAEIYVERGVTPEVATLVAQQLMAKDAFGAHARDELGISTQMTARPVQAALTSAFCFSIGAAAPLALVLVSPEGWVVSSVAAGSVMFLAVLGAVGARVGGAGIIIPTLRVLFWGTTAMVITAGVGKLFGTIV